MTSAGISTHVLDTTRGAPAAGVAVSLFRREGTELVEAGSGTTGEVSRVATLPHAAVAFHAPRTTYFIGLRPILAPRKLGPSPWRGSLFAWMTRNAGDVTSYFCLPPNGVVELGARVEV